VKGNQKGVLVVDDEPRMAKLLERALGAAGFQPSVATSGLAGLDRLRSGTFSLMVLDLTLPDVDGVSVLASAQESHPDLSVLVLSAISDVRSKVVCLELGARDYMTKPFELPELIARVRLHTRERAGAETRHLHAGRVTLDLQRRVVETPNGNASLTSREVVLLEFLIRNQGDACTRDAIREHVWGSSYDPGTNVVDVCIGRLRQKLGGDAIETVRNVGYAFVGA
jgi:DNA-binding response OmpR family regulator